MNPVVTSLGRVQPLYKGTYIHGTEYNYLDNVLYQGSTYVSLVNGNINHYPSDLQYWQLIASQGIQGPQGYTGSFGTPTATASILEIGANPQVNISASGPDEGKIFSFEFGIPAGPYGFDTVSASASGLGAGTSPTVEATLDTSSSSRILSFEFGIPAADGQGAQYVDNIGANSSNNIELSAVRYAQQNLSNGQKIIARNNIGAVAEPSRTELNYGDFLRYAGDESNPSWVGEQILQVPGGGYAGYILRKQVDGYGWTAVREVPSGGKTGEVLTKSSDNDYMLTWSSAISSADINNIIGE